jgi:hypothetical protein
MCNEILFYSIALIAHYLGIGIALIINLIRLGSNTV